METETETERLLEKLACITDDGGWNDWSTEEKVNLLKIYLCFSQKESHIFKLIYDHHGCDSWEDIFRDYDLRYLVDKARGVEIAVEEIERQQESGENAN